MNTLSRSGRSATKERLIALTERSLSKVIVHVHQTFMHPLTNIIVLGIRNLDVPLPHQPTYFTCVLNNGIHFVETPASKFENESLIDQEFEL